MASGPKIKGLSAASPTANGREKSQLKDCPYLSIRISFLTLWADGIAYSLWHMKYVA
jgi:hypothetical protein